MTTPSLAIVLDLDGTLIDSLPDIQRSLSTTLASIGRRALDRAEVIPMLGDGAEVLVARALAHTGPILPPDEERAFHARFLAHYERHGADSTRPFPGVEATLATLRAAGHRLGVCTNKPHRSTLGLLSALRLDRAVDTALGGDAIPRCKPHPDHLWATVRAMGAGDLPVVMVGDTEPDAEVAQRAGVPFVLAAYGYLRVPREAMTADAIIDRFEELPAALDALAW